MGIGRIVNLGWKLIDKTNFSSKDAKKLSLDVIEIIDLFLVATVAYIVAFGLYRLFIYGKDLEFPIQMKIRNLKDLEDKIIGIIIAALAVAFLGLTAGATDPEDLLHYGGGIALVIAALALFMKMTDKYDDKKD